MFYSGKTAWVIGASSGIGEELCKQLAEKGAKVILSARNEANLQTVKSGLKNSEQHIVFPIDLEHMADIENKTNSLVERVGEIDFLFNNGGLSQRATAFDTQLSIDRKIMEINYFGNIAVSKSLLPQMRKQGGGNIIVISSIAGKFGFFLRSAYSASKHALHGFYESLRLEEEDHNIRVNIMCPGKIKTDISKNALTESGNKYGVMDPNQEKGMSVEACVKVVLSAVKKNKFETLIGGRETKAVFLKRFFPKMLFSILKKQSVV
jgi:dehydrogenase/reductase SDR family protein 7B